MKKIKSIQLKSAFLLTVFSLNTIIGFACAVGLDMGFNSHHHRQEAVEAAVHVHSDGKEHHHNHKAQEHHDESVRDNHHANDKDNCCNGGVIKFQQVDKNVAASFGLINPVFLNALLTSFYNIDILSSNNRISAIKYFVRRHQPPIPDIRIAIQSFQI
ncbi:MAG: hypothetical protein ACTHMD_12365 [Flavisolibacter sp.]